MTIADCRLDRASREIVREGRRVRLAEKPFLVLDALIDARGQVVTRAALRKRLWADDTFVDFDNNLNSAVASLRQALGDSARAPRYIETLPKVGYRLVVPVEYETAERSRPAFDIRRSLPAAAVFALTVLGVIAAARVGFPRVAPAEHVARSDNREAQAAFERGAFLRQQYHAGARDARALTEARQAFQLAAGLDVRFADATAQEADVLVDLGFAGARPFRSSLDEARVIARRAAALDSRNATALRVLGVAALLIDWDVRASTARLDRAAALAPADARTALARAMLFGAEGRYAEAIAEAERAVRLDPGTHFVRADLAMFYLAGGRNDEALSSARAVLAAAPDFVPAWRYEALASSRLGRWSDAARAAGRLMELSGASAEELDRVARLEPRAAVVLWRQWDLERTRARAEGHLDDYALSLALRHAAAGDRDAALEFLARAIRQRAAFVAFLRSFPEFAELQGDPRFEQLARRVLQGGGVRS